MLTSSELKYGVLGRLSAVRQKIQYRNFRPTCGEDAVVYGIDDQVAYLTRLLERGNMEMFLRRLAEVVTRLHDAGWAKGLFVPELDELARRASLMISPEPNQSVNSGVLLHVATGVYPTGGHSRVIRDIVSSLPEYRHELIVSGMSTDGPDLRFLAGLDRSVNVHGLRSSSLAGKAGELSSSLASLHPDAVMLFGNSADSIMSAGVTHQSANRVLFFHHVDHYPCLGASRTDFIHVDLTPACHEFCKSRLHTRPAMLNLTVRDASAVEFTNEGALIGATCGSPHKYAGSTEFSYAQLLAALFSAGLGRIFHIGDMPEDQKNQIRSEVIASGQDATRIKFLPNVPSLTAKLLEISPDFYLVSHPVGSGKATLEAMSIGLPVLHPRPPSASPLMAVDMTLGTSIVVPALERVPSAIQRLRSERAGLARASRTVYEQHYSPAAFRQNLLSLIET